MTQVRTEQAGRPDLAIPRDEIAHRLRGRANQLDGVQNAGDVTAVLREPGEEFAAGIAGEQRVRDHLVAAAQLFDALGERPFLAFRGGDEVEQRVGNAAARRQHDAEPWMRVLLEDASDALHA
jgi:hypothetical protein